MVSKKKKRDENGGIEQQMGNNVGGVAEYEQSREQRIKENVLKMQKLGILHLSRNLKPPPKPKTLRPQKPAPQLSGSPRRSSRIKTLPSVNYVEKRVPNTTEKGVKEVKIEIKEGSQPEVYTEEHEKMLGDHKETWALFVDGYDEEGDRMYDQYNGKSCHQCRQKTLGHHTKCSKCKRFHGQFCGDCLFMRYGENILEANANPDWVCPVCRDICNCSCCRRVKGWEPTGNVYRKAIKLGFKSVAHYLVHTRGPHRDQYEAAEKMSSASEDSVSPIDIQDEVSDGKSVPQMDDKNDVNMHGDSKHHVLTEEDIKNQDLDQKQRNADDDMDSDYDGNGDDEDYIGEED